MRLESAFNAANVVLMIWLARSSRSCWLIALSCSVYTIVISEPLLVGACSNTSWITPSAYKALDKNTESAYYKALHNTECKVSLFCSAYAERTYYLQRHMQSRGEAGLARADRWITGTARGSRITISTLESLIIGENHAKTLVCFVYKTLKL